MTRNVCLGEVVCLLRPHQRMPPLLSFVEMMENRCHSPFLIQGGFLNQLFQFLCCFSAVLTIMAIGLSHLYQEGTFKVVAYQPISAFIHLN